MFHLSASGDGPIARVVARTHEATEPLPAKVEETSADEVTSELEVAVRLRPMRRRLGLASLLLVLFLTFMDNTVISVTLANVQTVLHTGISQLQWVINGYALVFASFMLLFGTLSDQLGRKKIMLSGVILFCCGSVVAALAPNADTLIAGRVIMGLGAAASEPGTLSMIRHLYPEKRARAKALGIWAGVSGLALAMGPLVGGVLVGLYSFRAVFWFNLFFGLVALVGAAVILPESVNSVRYRLDFAGFLLGAGSLAAASFAVIQGETAGYRNLRIDILFGASVVLAVFFVLYERTVAHPDPRRVVLQTLGIRRANVVAFCTYFGTFSIFFFVALYLQDVGTSSGYATALDFVPMAGAMIVASLFAGRWVARSGPTAADDGRLCAGRNRHHPDRSRPDPELGIVDPRLDAPDSRRRLRNRDRAGDLDGAVCLPAAALGHGGVGHQHQPRARRCRRRGGPRVDGERPADLQPDPPAQHDRDPEVVPGHCHHGGDHRHVQLPGEAVQRDAGDNQDRQRGDPGRLRRLRPRP